MHGKKRFPGKNWEDDGFSERVWDPAVCLLWWKFILRSSAFPTSTRTPFRVHYAKSITFAFSLCVEPLNSITIACCHDNTIMHFLQRGNGMILSAQSLECIMQSRWCESLETIWIMTAASLTCRVSEKTHFILKPTLLLSKKEEEDAWICLPHSQVYIHILHTHARKHQRAGFICYGLAHCRQSLLLFRIAKVPSSLNYLACASNSWPAAKPLVLSVPDLTSHAL